MKSKIAPDKLKHFWWGLALGFILEVAALKFMHSWLVPTLLSFLILVVICYGFELFSKITGWGHYDIWDALAGIFGGTLGIIFVLITAALVQN